MADRPKGSTETRQRIMEAALAAFVRSGYHSTTMDDIAAESGTSKGTLYWYFDSKEDLFETVIREVFADAFGEEALARLGAYSTASGKLRALARSMVAFIQEVQGLFNLFLEFWASSSHQEQAADLWMDLCVQYKDVIVEIVEDGIEAREFRPVDAEPLVWALMSAYDGLAAYAKLNPDLDLLRIHEAYIETLIRGLEVEG